MTTQTETDVSVDTRFRALHELIADGMERFHVPGVALGVLHESQEHLAGFGVTNVDVPSPVTGDTLFQIGSTTKTVTATGMLRLAAEGKIELDAAVRTYLPDLQLADEAVAAGVTVRHLLQHMGGWEGDLFEDTGRGDDALAIYVGKMAGFPQLTPLGTVWSYNNAGFSLAGRVIEAVTGRPYEAAIRELVLDPLGMTDSLFFPEEVMLRSFAVGHLVVDDRPKVARPWPIPRSSNPAGGIASSARDQLRYARFHMGGGTAEDGTRVLPAESMKQMQTPLLPAGDGRQMALAWFIREVQGVRIVQHGGGTNGQISTFLFAPDGGFVLTILTNSNLGGSLNREVEKLALKRLLGIEEPEPAALERSEEELAPYAGWYELSSSRLQLTVRDAALYLEVLPGGVSFSEDPLPPPPPARTTFYEEDKMIVTEGPSKDARGEFLRGPDGAIAWLRIGSRIHRRVG